MRTVSRSCLRSGNLPISKTGYSSSFVGKTFLELKALWCLPPIDKIECGLSLCFKMMWGKVVMRSSDKVALIMGASSEGIGRAIAVLFELEGSRSCSPMGR